MRTLLGFLWVFLLVSGLAFAQESNATKVEHILKQARATIAEPIKLSALSSLSAAVTSSRTINGNPAESEIEYDILLPDKFRRKENRQPFATVTVIDEDNTATYRVPLDTANGNQGRENLTDPQAQVRRKDDFARVLLGWLLLAPPYEAAEFSYAGEYKEPDGTADMIDVKGKSGFTTRLYFDQKTGRLLMLTYRGKQLSAATRAIARTAPAAPTSEAGLSAEQKEKMRQARAAMIEQRRKEFEAALAKAPEVEYRWVFSDYKNVRGYVLPHRVVKSEAGHEFEEWTITSFKINPKLNPAIFETK